MFKVQSYSFIVIGARNTRSQNFSSTLELECTAIIIIEIFDDV